MEKFQTASKSSRNALAELGVANVPRPPIIAEMRLSRILIRLALVAALAALGIGCSGINNSYGVSPASFLLPGLLQNDPQPAFPDFSDPTQGSVAQVAQAD
jgi:hypothetical protein